MVFDIHVFHMGYQFWSLDFGFWKTWHLWDPFLSKNTLQFNSVHLLVHFITVFPITNFSNSSGEITSANALDKATHSNLVGVLSAISGCNLVVTWLQLGTPYYSWITLFGWIVYYTSISCQLKFGYHFDIPFLYKG